MEKTRWGFWRKCFLNELPSINPSDFIEPTTPIQHNFVLVGEMNDFEKAAYTWLAHNEKKLEELDAQLQRISQERYPNVERHHEVDAETASIFAQFSVLRTKVEAVKKILTVSIQERLKIPFHLRLVLAKGFQVCFPIEDLDKKVVLASLKVTIVRQEPNITEDEIPPSHQRH